MADIPEIFRGPLAEATDYLARGKRAIEGGRLEDAERCLAWAGDNLKAAADILRSGNRLTRMADLRRKTDADEK